MAASESIDSPSPRDMRNVGVLAHVDAGKTSITEKILHLAGLRTREGRVDEGTAMTDYLSVEKRHGITIKSAAVRFSWKNTTIHLIDTPGHIDFGIEVERALRILDGAVIGLCAVSGVQARTEAIAKACADRSLPRMYFVNKMDRNGADFPGVMENLAANLEPRAAAIQYPIYRGRTWAGVYDLVEGSASFLDGDGGPFEPGPEILGARERLVERLAEIDEPVLSRYAANAEVPASVIREALARATRSGALIPVLCGSAFSDTTISALLDAAVALLPSPAEAAIPENLHEKSLGQAPLRPEDPRLSAFVFKTLGDGSGDLIGWTRIWTGRLRSGARCFDARSGKDVQVKSVFGILADQLIELESAGAGEVAAVRASRIEAGASLCERSRPVLFELLKVPEPVVSQVVEPAGLKDTASIRRALETLALEDGSLEVREEKETGRFILSGQGELHLDIVAERLKREYGLAVRVGNPRINCKERPRSGTSVRERFDRDFGGERVRTEVEVRLEPREDTALVLSVAEGVRTGAIYVAAARRGLAAAAASGPLEGWPLEAAGIRVTDIVPPPGGTGRNGELAVEAAAALATRNALLSARCAVCEPVMRLDIECPEESFGPTLALVNSRGGRIESVEDRLSIKALGVRIALRSLFGFSGDLRAATGGRGQYQARFDSYEIMKQAFEA